MLLFPRESKAKVSQSFVRQNECVCVTIFFWGPKEPKRNRNNASHIGSIKFSITGAESVPQ